MTVGRIDEPEDTFRNGIDIVITLVIRRGHIFRNVHPGMVLIVKGGGSRALAHKVFGEPGNPVFLLEERKVPPIAHGTGGQDIADGSVPHFFLHHICHVPRATAQGKAVAVLQFEPDVAVVLPHKLLQHLDDPFAVHLVCSSMWLPTGLDHGNRFCQP